MRFGAKRNLQELEAREREAALSDVRARREQRRAAKRERQLARTKGTRRRARRRAFGRGQGELGFTKAEG